MSQSREETVTISTDSLSDAQSIEEYLKDQNLEYTVVYELVVTVKKVEVAKTRIEADLKNWDILNFEID